MTAKKTHGLRNTLLVLIVCAIAGAGISVTQFNKNVNRTYASSSIQLSFDGAASGIAPSGKEYDLKELYLDDVLNEALKNAGMEDRYTADMLRSNLEINGSYPSDIAAQLTNYDSLLDFSTNRAFSAESYYPTFYSVILYNDFDKSISRADLSKLLENTLASYRDYFTKVYAITVQNAEIEYADLTEYDYPQKLSVLSAPIDQSRSLAQELSEKASSFLVNGIGFNDIYVRLDSLIDTNITQLNATVMMSSISKQAERLLNQYRYGIKTLTNRLEKQKKRLANLDALIASYDKNDIIYLSSTDSLTKIDGNSSETYDAMVAERKTIDDGITQITTRINNYNLLISDLLKGAQTQEASSAEIASDSGETTVMEMSQVEIDKLVEAAQAEAAEKMAAVDAEIDLVVKKYQEIMEDFSVLIKNYNALTFNDASIEIFPGRYYTPSLLSGQFLVLLIKTVGPICCCGLIVCLIILIIQKRKQYRQNTVNC